MEQPILLGAQEVVELEQYLEKLKGLRRSLGQLRDRHGVSWSKNPEILLVSCVLTSKSDFTQYLDVIKAHQGKFANWSVRVRNSKYNELFDFKLEPHLEDSQISIFSFKAAPTSLLKGGKLAKPDPD